MKIYTRSGDRGKTGIHGGQRVDKDNIRIEANGCMDELNSMLGAVRSFLPEEHEWHELLFKIQSEIMAMMSHVATPSEIRDKNPNRLDEDIVLFVENRIDDLLGRMEGEQDFFVLPGGTPVSSHLHLARTIARRSERRLWTLNREDELPAIILRFVNRLSDLLFVMARFEMFSQNLTEEKWRLFSYKSSYKRKKE
ncbi:MAG: cob(I)yrinic acid a,c-diamide adenosyltransferase [Prevotellaceae bacterium]|jgi:ATP:cob(I)alamin adenosyltransferase|nr:cob(I)yrinic acid a,c-diamide adenosyltransferase [Prevotellaceae bacterium]